MVYNVYMSENNKMTFEEFCVHMYSENCHERREHNEIEYPSLSEYVNHGENKRFLVSEYNKFLLRPRPFLA
jgi:hypothetical protein